MKQTRDIKSIKVIDYEIVKPKKEINWVVVFGLLWAIMLCLKLAGVIQISWPWVFIPMVIVWVLMVAIMVLMIIKINKP